MAYKRFIVMLGIFLGSLAPAAGQTPAPRFILANEPVTRPSTMLRPVSTPSLNAAFLLKQDPGKSPAHFSYIFAGANEREYSTERLPPTDEVKTLLFTQSSLPLVQLWSGRLQLDAFQNTLRVENVQLDPLGYGGALERRPATNVSGRPACGRSLRHQPKLSLWPGCSDGAPDPGMAAHVADCWQCFALNRTA